MEDLERFLSLVGRELDAIDAHLRLGGKDPTDPRTVFVELEPGVRLVAQFSARPAEPARVRDRLVALARTFDGTVHRAAQKTRSVDARAKQTSEDELTHALDVLADRTDASGIVIVDDRSPVLWGHSADRGGWLDQAQQALARSDDDDFEPPNLEAQTFDRPRDIAQTVGDAVLLARGCDSNQLIRGRNGGVSIRCFGGIYRLALAFDSGFSPLHVETTVSKALPAIERLVEGLPPVEPPPTRASVTRLRPL